LKAAPYGWPQDAIDAALIALHRSGHLRATRNGQPVHVGGLDQAGIRGAEFRPERVRLTTAQRIALRGLFDRVGVATRSGEEELRAPAFLDAVSGLATDAGGAAPLPPVPETSRIDDLKRLAGTEQLAAILDRKDEIDARIGEWRTLTDRAVVRRQDWDLVIALRRHAAGLPQAADIGPQLDAILSQRSLLDETDHVSPMVGKLAAALRAALTDAHAALTSAVAGAATALATDAAWTKLDPDAQAAILRAAGLDMPVALNLSTDEALIGALDARPLASWADHLDAVPQRVSRALAAATACLMPPGSKRVTTTVAIRRATLVDEAAVRAWVEEHEQKLLEATRKGPVIVS
ncbi:MAG: BREX system P-loop protein BrxC, partial [Gaiellales bacterium]